ncbi:MAG: inositol monophosphatase family protein [Candidatus Paceibacterota bacterium]
MKDFITQTIKVAGDELMKRFKTVDLQVQTKGEGINDIMTEADLASQRVMVQAIEREYPNHHIVAEEGDYSQASVATDAPYTWFLDPLDGTLNFSSEVELFGINIGVWDNKKKQVTHAAIYLPATDELCYAEIDKGTELNEKIIHSSKQNNWKKTYGIGNIGVNQKENETKAAVSELSDGEAWCSAIASPAVTGVWLAAGRRDWYISRGSSPWDYAGPSLVMSQAGCTVTDFAGKSWQPDSGNLVVTNGSLDYEALLQKLQSL